MARRRACIRIGEGSPRTSVADGEPMTFLRTLFASLLLLGPLLAACSDDDVPATSLVDVGAPLAAEAETACVATAQSACTRVDACSPPLMAYAFGDRTRCEREVLDACRKRYHGEARDPRPAACDYAKDSCESVLETVAWSSFAADRGRGSALVALCSPTPGRLAAGERCVSDGDCTTGLCAGSSGSCSTCQERRAEGATCTGHDCAAGLRCSVLEKKCERATAKLGEACDETRTCEGDDISTKCRSGVCVARGLAGAACGEGTAGCDLGRGFACNRAGVCEAIPLPAAGESCAAAGTLNLALCRGGAECGRTGVCEARAGSGEACGTETRCRTPYTCFEGTCRLMSERRRGC